MTSPDGILTTHVGSLPRSDELRELLASDAIRDSATFEEAVTAAVRDAVRKQAAAGVDIANDGEQSRLAYSVDVTTRLAGFGDDYADRDLPADLEEYPAYAEEALGGIDHIGGPVATGPIEYVDEAGLRNDLARFDQAVEAEDVTFTDQFHTAPSPGAIRRFTESAYHDSVETYLFDLADALRTEYRLIVESGAILQIDAPDLLASYTIGYKDDSIETFREHVRLHVEAINRALDGLPTDRVRMHACWGNYPGPHHRDVELADVIDLFYEADVDSLLIEGANPRHAHEYRTIEDYPPPEHWSIVPGVIDVKTNIVEHPEVVADRLERFAAAVGSPERVVAGADCGFETVLSANLVHPDLVWKKLEALVEGASLASARVRA